MSKTNQEMFGKRLSEKRKSLGVTQKDLSVASSVSVTSIQNYENGQIPGGDILLRIASALSCSMEWLLTGEGEMMRGAAPAQPAPAAAAPRQDAIIYNDTTRRSISIADMLAKTAKVLESDTVYREALYSNIEAFHHGVTMDERLSKMEEQFSQVMGKVQEQLDLNTQTISELKADNARLKEELASCRVRDELSDTG